MRGRPRGPFSLPSYAALKAFLTLIGDGRDEGRDIAMGAEYQIDMTRRNGRLAERRHVRVPVKVRRPGETWFKSQIADLSVNGFRLQSFMKLNSGDTLWVMLPGFEGRRALVLWTRGHEAGCQFERALHPAILDHIVKISL